jgi:hypothetical protein
LVPVFSTTVEGFMASMKESLIFTILGYSQLFFDFLRTAIIRIKNSPEKGVYACREI